MSTCAYQYTKQGEKLISYIYGHRGGKIKDGIFFKNHVDVPTAEQSFPHRQPSEQQCLWSWVPGEQNIGGNTQGKLHSDVFIPNEHLLLSIIPQGTTDKLILALKKIIFPA